MSLWRSWNKCVIPHCGSQRTICCGRTSYLKRFLIFGPGESEDSERTDTKKPRKVQLFTFIILFSEEGL